MAPNRMADRRKGAKAELLQMLADLTEEWAAKVVEPVPTGEPATTWGTPSVFAIDTWPATDPLRILRATYNLTPRQFAEVLTALGQELEARAERIGYSDRPEPADPGPPMTRYV